jgi:hypothetical protein
VDDHANLVDTLDVLADADLVRDIREALTDADADEAPTHDDLIADLTASGKMNVRDGSSTPGREPRPAAPR